MTKRERVKGALYAFAIGDAMGATTEFKTRRQVQQTYGKVEDIIGGGWLKLKAGQVTDDTDMMLLVAQAVSEGQSEDEILDDCCTLFKMWYASGPVDVGGTIGTAIRMNYRSTSYEDWMDNSRLVQKFYWPSYGNGSLMRCLFPILYYLDSPNDLYLKQGRLTHNNSTCDNALRIYRTVIQALYKHGRIDYLTRTLEDLGARLGSPRGHVLDTLNNALYYVKNCQSLEQAIINAVNNGGDADTIAAITGGLVGFKFGFESIPSRWIKQLDPKVVEKIEKYLVKIV